MYQIRQIIGIKNRRTKAKQSVVVRRTLEKQFDGTGSQILGDYERFETKVILHIAVVIMLVKSSSSYKEYK